MGAMVLLCDDFKHKCFVCTQKQNFSKSCHGMRNTLIFNECVNYLSP